MQIGKIVQINNQQCFCLGILFLAISVVFLFYIYFTNAKTFTTAQELKNVKESNQYAKIEASVMTDYFAIHDYAGVEHKTYFIWDAKNVYLVDLNEETRKQLEEIYTYSYNTVDTNSPSSVTIKGIAKVIPKDLQLTAMSSLNKILEQDIVTEENSKDIFGIYYLDTFDTPMFYILEKFLIVLPTLSMGLFFFLLLFLLHNVFQYI